LVNNAENISKIDLNSWNLASVTKNPAAPSREPPQLLNTKPREAAITLNLTSLLVVPFPSSPLLSSPASNPIPLFLFYLNNFFFRRAAKAEDDVEEAEQAVTQKKKKKKQVDSDDE